VLLEAEELGSGSSGALAGMLSGQGEAEKPGPLRDLLLQGREYHRRTFAQELYEATGLDPGYVWNGALRTATDEASKKGLLKEHYCPVRIRVSPLLLWQFAGKTVGRKRAPIVDWGCIHQLLLGPPI
jgi:hypothetical protein